jgi:hypothetical protein
VNLRFRQTVRLRQRRVLGVKLEKELFNLLGSGVREVHVQIDAAVADTLSLLDGGASDEAIMRAMKESPALGNAMTHLAEKGNARAKTLAYPEFRARRAPRIARAILSDINSDERAFRANGFGDLMQQMRVLGNELGVDVVDVGKDLEAEFFSNVTDFDLWF